MPWRIWPKAASLAMNTMDPPPASFMAPIADWVAATAEKKLTSIVRCHLSRSVSVAMKPGTDQPALFTRTSIPPHACTARPTARSAPSALVRSAIASSTAAAPRSSASARTFSAWGSSMSLMTMRAPAPANWCTMPRPMLAAPPVTSTECAPRRIGSEFDVRQIGDLRPTRGDVVDGGRLGERRALVLKLGHPLDVCTADDVHAAAVGALCTQQVSDHGSHLRRRELV